MNIYQKLNQITNYIEDNLENKIDYNILSKMLGVNTYTMNRLFTMLANISLSDYIRKRRLSIAGFDLYNEKQKVIDVALKYQYNNPTSFSRAFYQFHGIKPSKVNKETKLKNFPQIIFDENININKEYDYEIINLKQLQLYGKYIKTNNKNINLDAPKFFKQMKKKYGNIKYAMTTYDKERQNCQKYYCLFTKKIDNNFETITIPPSKWLKFKINTQNEQDIQKTVLDFYNSFLPSCKYNLKELPELEYYHDNQTDFLIAIY